MIQYIHCKFKGEPAIFFKSISALTMKKHIASISFVSMFILLFTFTSCSSEDDANDLVPVVTYSTDTLQAEFFVAGNSLDPNIEWNGTPGTLSLSNPVSGLSVNPTTGKITWTKQLPLGIHDFSVLATNSAGTTTINLVINNPFQGVFTGTYDSNFFYEIEFFKDGSIEVRADSEANPSLANGIWMNEGGSIRADYTYLSGGDFSVLGTLTLNDSAVYSGNWFFDHGSIIGNEGGIFEVVMH